MKKLVASVFCALTVLSIHGVAAADPTCVTIQRGTNGSVQDSDLSPGNGNWAAGAYPYLWTGGSDHHALIQFDLSSIPEGATVVSAKLTVYQQWTSQSGTVNGHQVLQPWSEASVSWSNFGNPANWSAAVAGSFTTTDVGYRDMILTDLVADWVSGAAPNYGIALDEAGGAQHAYWASERSNVAQRPSLTVCYEEEAAPPPCPCMDSAVWASIINNPIDAGMQNGWGVGYACSSTPTLVSAGLLLAVDGGAVDFGALAAYTSAEGGAAQCYAGVNLLSGPEEITLDITDEEALACMAQVQAFIDAADPLSLCQ
ncbi:MAG: DNRLRE domain-containing protein [Polyangiaceae bacterium]|nr:DNRLRE domain-containing protein [Polyangiaceae bacterium]